MKFIRLFSGLLLAGLLLSACQAAAPTEGAASPTSAAAYPAATSAGNEAQPAAPSDAVQMVDGYPVLPGDENKAFGNFYIDKAELRANASNAAQTDLFVTGSLPTPCNEIRAYVEQPNENKEVRVRVYSVADKDKVCTQALQPYEGVATTLTGIPAGTYTVVANDITIGEVTIP